VEAAGRLGGIAFSAVQLTHRPSIILKSQVFDDVAGFASLSSEWNVLAESIPRHRLFLTHEWFDAALAWQGERRPAFFTAREGSHLVGAAAIAFSREKHRGIPLRVLRFVTVPDTQFCDLLAMAAHAQAVACAFAAWLRSASRQWDVLQLDYLAEDSTAARWLPDALQSVGIGVDIEIVDRNPWVSLEGTWLDFLNSRSRRLKKAINLAANRLSRAGRVDIECASAISNADVASALSSAIAISSRSWKQPLGVSLDCPGPSAFISKLSEHAQKHGWLVLWLLSLDGEPTAMEYQLADAEHVYALRADYDERCVSTSPGTHLNRELIERLFAFGRKRYYMGPGSNEYKWRWTEQYETIARLTAYSPNALGMLARFVDRRVVPALAAFRSRRSERNGRSGK
jgi:CelD/BcsL family acetyltransferase involved in cellulose biosynthesis